MKINTSELEGAALDWAVARAVGEDVRLDPRSRYADASTGHKYVVTSWDMFVNGGDVDDDYWEPSADWSQGGPLIERHQVSIACDPAMDESWEAEMRQLPSGFATGSTPIIAAMRAIVASEIGDEVDVPEELL